MLTEVQGLIVQKQTAQIGKRAVAFRQRIHQHVLVGRRFDEADSAWLSMTLAAFLYVIDLRIRPSRIRRLLAK